MPEINYIALVAAAIASMVIGSIWYGPLFGKLFMEGVGMNEWSPEKKEAMKNKMGITYLQQFILSLLMAFVFSQVLWAFGQADPTLSGVSAGLQGGFWMWLGFALPIRYGDALWNGKAFKYTAIDLGYWLVLLLAYGIILSVWK